MSYEELKETIVSLVGDDKLTKFQLEVALEWLQSNGLIDRSEMLEL